jgi:hypothetical protein
MSYHSTEPEIQQQALSKASVSEEIKENREEVKLAWRGK